VTTPDDNEADFADKCATTIADFLCRKGTYVSGPELREIALIIRMCAVEKPNRDYNERSGGWE
jgi:hypothetical protein